MILSPLILINDSYGSFPLGTDSLSSLGIKEERKKYYFTILYNFSEGLLRNWINRKLDESSS